MLENKSISTTDTNSVPYRVYVPGGNATALVEKLGYTPETRKVINDKIMEKHSDLVEQVGFVDKTVATPELMMAGGEFCGNATRSAAYYYLNGKPGQLKIKVCGQLVNAGVYENGDAWCEIPLYLGNDQVTYIEEGVYKVKMDGMTTLVVNEDVSRKYLDDRENIKKHGMDFIHRHHLEECEAVGVMFLERLPSTIKINPVVWVKAIDTLFYETACGSGTTATAMVEAYKTKQDQSLDILQPSGHRITAQIVYNEGKVTSARISGVVETDNCVEEVSF